MLIKQKDDAAARKEAERLCERGQTVGERRLLFGLLLARVVAQVLQQQDVAGLGLRGGALGRRSDAVLDEPDVATEVTAFYQPGIGGIIDATEVLALPPVAPAGLLIVPEPSGAALQLFGISLLAVCARRMSFLARRSV